MRVVEGRAEIDDLDAFLARLGENGAEFDCAVQAFDADLVVGRRHLETAVERADRSFERGENVARDRAVEILLYAAGRRQINRSLRMGVSEGRDDAVVVVHDYATDASAATNTSAASNEETTSDEAAAADAVSDLLVPAETLDADRIDREAVREFFDVDDAELDATDATLTDLVCERVALLDVEK